jgi:hypothetical protein
MFSLFRKGTTSPETIMPGAQRARRMSLEERMAFRRDLADQLVRESLQALAVTSEHYQFRLMPLDPRHHRYIVMLDVAQGFAPRQGGRAWSEAEVERWIRRNAYERYGLTIEGIFWRTGEDVTAPELRGRSRITGRSGGPAEAQRPWQLVSDEEKQALMDAIREGSELPVLHVGELEYLTDLAPLERQGPASGRRR